MDTTEMSLIQIDQLDMGTIVDEVRATVRPRLDAERLGEFLSAVDWSDMERADPTVLRVLGELEALSTAFAENDITPAEFESRLGEYLRPVARAV